MAGRDGTLEFRMLGPLEVVDGDEVTALGETKPGEVLAVLLLNVNRPLSIDVLIDSLWGESPPATARKSLQTHIWQLRKVLEPKDDPSVLITHGSSYELRASPDHVDALRFQSLLEEARAKERAEDHLAARDLFDQALKLWRGPPLADFRYRDFAQGEIFRLEDLRLQAFEERAEADLALGRHTEVIGELRSLVTEQPLREHLWELLALALYRSGRVGEAIQVCREAKETLKRELDVPPGPILRDLAERIRRGDDALDWRSPLLHTRERGAVGTDRPLVGRDEELARLHAIFDEIYEGRGWVITVAGEPGIGKTRLLREFEPYVLMRGGRMLWGRPHRDMGTPAYWPVTEILTEHVAGLDAERSTELGPQPSALAELVPEMAERFEITDETTAPHLKEHQLRVFEAVGSYLAKASAGEPLVLVVDDLQWADEPTLLLLRHLPGRLDRARVLLVAAFRDDEFDGAHALAETLDQFSRSARYQPMPLSSLSLDAVELYLSATLPAESLDTGMIHHATDGNPYFLVELVSLLGQARGLTETEIPHVLTSVIRRRVGRLSADARWVLNTAAVIGPSFEPPLVASLLGMPSDRVLELVEEAVAAGLVESADRTDLYSFSHDLTRDALVDDLSVSEKLRLHGRIGQTLEDMAGRYPERVAARLAYHFTRSGKPHHLKRALHFEVVAGEEAAKVAGWEQARDHYQRALRLLDRLGDDDPAARGDLQLRLSTCRRLSGDVAGAGTALFQAFDDFQRAGYGPGMAEVVIKGLSDEVFIDSDRAIALTDEALAANRDAPPELRAQLLARRAWEPLGYDDTSNRAAQEAIELAVRHGLADIEAVMHDRETHRVLHEGRFAEARELARTGYQAAHRVGNAELAAHTLTEIMGTHNMDGDLDAALHAAHRVVEYGEEHGALFWTQVARVVAARIHILRGDPEQMEELIHDLPEQVFLSPLLARATWAEMTGDLEEAGLLATRAVESLPLHRMAAFLRGIYLGMHTRVAFHRGDEAAARLAFAGWREAIEESFGQYRAAAVGEIDEALPELADPELVEEIYEELCGHDARASFPAWPLDYLRGRLAHELEWTDRAVEHFHTGLGWAERVRSPIEAGRNLLGLARIARTRGEPDDDLISRAVDLLTAHGAHLYLEEAGTH